MAVEVSQPRFIEVTYETVCAISQEGCHCVVERVVGSSLILLHMHGLSRLIE
jgi:hypothetical protein